VLNFSIAVSSSGAGGSCEKKIKTKNVAVAQPGQPNKLLLDTVEDNAVVGAPIVCSTTVYSTTLCIVLLCI